MHLTYLSWFLCVCVCVYGKFSSSLGMAVLLSLFQKLAHHTCVRAHAHMVLGLDFGTVRLTVVLLITSMGMPQVTSDSRLHCPIRAHTMRRRKKNTGQFIFLSLIPTSIIRVSHCVRMCSISRCSHMHALIYSLFQGWLLKSVIIQLFVLCFMIKPIWCLISSSQRKECTDFIGTHVL